MTYDDSTPVAPYDQEVADRLLHEATDNWATHLLGECDPETCNDFTHRTDAGDTP